MKICPRSPSALRLRRWIGIALVSLLSMAAHAQNAIEAVTSTARADVELVRIDFTHPLAALPTGIVVQEPARIALDFPGVANAVGRSAIEFNLGNLRSANVVQAGERSRVVLTLKHATTYQAEIQGRLPRTLNEPLPAPQFSGMEPKLTPGVPCISKPLRPE